MIRPSIVAVAVLALLYSCSEEPTGPTRAPARPVVVRSLEEGAPPPQSLIPGLVKPYREVQVPFEVSGRIVRLIDVGDEVDGEITDLLGEVTQAGTVIAELDPAPYERAVRQAERRLDSARAQLVAEQVQLEQVLPAKLESARSNREAARSNVKYAEDDVASAQSAVGLAETNLERNRKLLPTGAVSDIAVRESETEVTAEQARLAQSRTLVTTRQKELEASSASVAEAESNLALQEANIAAQRASIEELEQQLLDAHSDLEDCVLRAPFGGRVTEVHVGEGSVVQAGHAVVTLTMMNPIKVELTLSADIEEELVLGTDAVVFPMNGSMVDRERLMRATLFEKAGVANAGTRTFTVGLIAVNERRTLRTDLADKPTAPYLVPVFENPLDLPGEYGLFTLISAVGDLDGDPYVLRVRNLSEGQRSAESLTPVLDAERIEVELAETALRVGSFSLVELLRAEGLAEGDLLVALPTPAHADGFLVFDNRWLLRPGELVQVTIDRPTYPAGFYVPVQAIQEVNGETSVFLLQGEETARRVAVETAESVGELRRIESPELVAGAFLVVDGAHFLLDGDRISPRESSAGR